MSAILNLLVKTGKSLKVHKLLPSLDKVGFKYVDELVDGVAKPTLQTKANVGDVSIWAESILKEKQPSALLDIQCLFSGLKNVDPEKDIISRSKSALSIETKMMRGLKKKNEFKSMDDALSVIGDGIGTRVFTPTLEKLSEADIDKMIADMTYNGKTLSPKRVKMLKNYIYSKNPSKESNEAYKLYEAFAQPLIEKRTKEVVDRLTLGILKHRQLKEGLDLKDLQARGLLDDDLFKRLETEDIMPIKIKEINNYRGAHGLPEFSNRQIQQLGRALCFGKTDKKVFINSDVRGLDDFLYSAEEIAEHSAKAIKASGYRTAQMNVVHQNGALGELQIRGRMTNMIGEYEHIAYDLRQGKNTLGPIFDDFTKAISKLSDRDYAVYNTYLEECYNYYNKIELGLPAFKPKLPSRFPKILSEESMKSLHDKAEVLEKIQNKNFVRTFENVA